MSKINRLPWGLQDIVQAVSQGDNPNDLSREVKATFDIFPLWAMERVTSTRVTTTIVSRGTNLDISVPQSEIWLPWHFSCGIVGFNDIGTVIGFELLIDRFPGSPTVIPRYWSSQPFTSSEVGELISFQDDFRYPIAFGPGSRFRFSPTTYRKGGAVDDQGEAAIFYWRFNI